MRILPFVSSTVLFLLWITILGCGSELPIDGKIESGTHSQTLDTLPDDASLATDESDDLFVPQDYTPLSAFVDADASQPVSIAVRADVLGWADAFGGGVKIAQSGSEALITPTWNLTTGLVSFTPSNEGTFVVVCDALRNHYLTENGSSAVVTHWKSDTRDGRGTQRIGASDAIGLMSVEEDELDGSWIGLEKVAMSGGSFKNNITDDPTPTYYYNTVDYALFSDGTEASRHFKAPGYERYIGENYALYGYTEEAVIWFSDQIRMKTGYPVVHRNHPYAFNSSEAHQGVMSDVPVLQIVHAFEVTPPDDNPTDGNEHSLASFFLPPKWAVQSEASYPIIANGFYDIHGTTFEKSGPRFLEVIGKLYAENGDQAVGITWNGGGDDACQAMQRSAYDNAEFLFQFAQSQLAADSQKIIMSGGSRGGTTALNVASNPYPRSYKVLYALANNPFVQPGSLLEEYTNSTISGVSQMIHPYTGLYGSADPNWTTGVDENGKDWTGRELMLHNLLGVSGTSDSPAVAFQQAAMAADHDHAIASDSFVNGLLESGTTVILRAGTHDHLKPFRHTADYATRLVEKSVPLRFEINYRYGHGTTSGMEGYGVADALGWVLRPETKPQIEGTFHYKRPKEWGEEAAVGSAVPFVPEHQPMIVEAPLVQGYEDMMQFIVSGQPEAPYSIWALDVSNSGSGWFKLLNGVLPANSTTDHDAIMTDVHMIDKNDLGLDTHPDLAFPVLLYGLTYGLPGESDPGLLYSNIVLSYVDPGAFHYGTATPVHFCNDLTSALGFNSFTAGIIFEGAGHKSCDKWTGGVASDILF